MGSSCSSSCLTSDGTHDSKLCDTAHHHNTEASIYERKGTFESLKDHHRQCAATRSDTSSTTAGDRTLSPTAPMLQLPPEQLQHHPVSSSTSRPNLRVDASAGSTPTRAIPSPADNPLTFTPKLVYPVRNSTGASGGGFFHQQLFPHPPAVSSTTPRSIHSHRHTSARPPLSRQMSSLQSLPRYDDRSSIGTTNGGNLFDWAAAVFSDDTVSIAPSQRTIMMMPPTPSEDGRRSLAAFHVPRHQTPVGATAASSAAICFPVAAFFVPEGDDMSNPQRADSSCWDGPNRSTTDSLKSDALRRRSAAPSTAASSTWGGSDATGSFDHNNNMFSLPAFRPA